MGFRSLALCKGHLLCGIGSDGCCSSRGPRVLQRQNRRGARRHRCRQGIRYLQPHDGAPHRKHLPGNPSIVVQNMPGAGQLIAANHLYNRASRDGLTIGHFSGSVIFRDVMGDKSVMFDGKKFSWLGMAAPERHTCVITEKSGVRTLADWSAMSPPGHRFGPVGKLTATNAARAPSNTL